MYNHQLPYDPQLSTFLTDTKMTLNSMRGEIWATVYALAENKGITFDACLGLMLQVLNLLLQIPIDISFQAQIPLTISYCPESSIYRRRHPEQGGVSPLHKEVRASCTLSKVLGRITHQPSEGVDCPPSPAASDNSAGSGRLHGSRCQSHSHDQSITPACSQQSGSVSSAAGCHLVHSHATEDGEVSGSESELSHDEGDITGEDDNTKEDKGGVETSSDGQVASDRNALMLKTPSPALARSSVDTRTQTQSLTPGRKSSLSDESGAQKAPRRTAPLRSPANHLLRKSHQWTRHSMTRPGKKFGRWTHVAMPGIAK